MKVLLCHAYYAQRGGEDRSFEEERELLVEHGHDVLQYVRRNEDMNAMGSLRAAATTLWNRQAAADVGAIVRRERPDVVHFTNTFPLISPAACRAAHRGGAAVIQALRNYRLLCANSYLLRDGKPCNDCVGRAIPWPAVVHRCYRDSAAASAAVGAMQVLHRTTGTWRTRVDAFFTLTQFARQKFVAAGLPADRIHVKSNSVHPDPGVGAGRGRYVAFAARLSPEKGVRTLLEAWRLDATLPPLKVIGDGALLDEVSAAARSDRRIEAIGQRTEVEVQQIFGDATAVLVPSLWYETFGRTAAEAFAGGTPVIASRIGALTEVVTHGQTGWLVAAGNAHDLAAAVRTVAAMPPDELAAFRQRARREYETRFTPRQNYERLMEIYSAALASAAQRRTAQRPVSADEAVVTKEAAAMCGAVT